MSYPFPIYRPDVQNAAEELVSTIFRDFELTDDIDHAAAMVDHFHGWKEAIAEQGTVEVCPLKPGVHVSAWRGDTFLVYASVERVNRLKRLSWSVVVSYQSLAAITLVHKCTVQRGMNRDAYDWLTNQTVMARMLHGARQ